MTGFIRGLFNRNGKKSAAPQPRQTGAFFLSEDEAKTFGDIDYMRSSKVVKRTFAKKKGQTEEMESVRQISAMDMRNLDEKGLPAQTAKQQTLSSASSSSASQNGTSDFQRRTATTDTSMDMFRNMAKDIKKR